MPKRRAKPFDLSSIPQKAQPLVPARETWPDGWDAIGLSLWNVYASYRAQMHVGGGPDRFLAPNEDKLAVMYAMSAWCTSKQLDAALWIYAVFASIQWRSPTVGHLFSEKVIQHYKTWQSTNLDVHHQAKLTSQLAAPDSPVSEAGERVKHGFLSRSRLDLCMAAPELTGGYSPQSELCRGCPKAAQCSSVTSAWRQEHR
jgi:hypothetical protein